VPGDADTIQAGIDAAAMDDIVQVAAGDYTENLTLKAGVLLIGAGIDQTVLHGQILLVPGESPVVTGFTVTKDGACDLADDVGIRESCGGSGGITTLYHNAVEGFATGIELTNCTQVEVVRNRLRRNALGLRLQSCTGPVTDNLVWGNFTNYAGETAVDESDLSGDPLFTDIANDDFHLRPGSPAIDAGTDSAGTEVDFDGASRPRGAEVDIGAYEYRPTRSWSPRSTPPWATAWPPTI